MRTFINQKFNKEYGFSLVELLCILTLIGIMALVAAPAVQGLGQRHNLEIAARTMATEMRKAQQRAIMAGCGQIIEFHHRKRYRIRDGKTEETYTVELPEGVTRRSVNFPFSDNIRFLRYNYNGSPSSGGTVTLVNSAGEVLYVIVTPITGRVRISECPPEHWEIIGTNNLCSPGLYCAIIVQ